MASVFPNEDSRIALFSGKCFLTNIVELLYFQGRLHVKCQEKCTRVLVCGHKCKEPCAVNCPPCTQQCNVLCEHSKCKEKCSKPCVPCRWIVCL